MVIETSCGFLLINPTSDKILVLKQENSFEWGLPKGHQEEGEELIETAFREVQEEVNINKEEIEILKDSEGNLLNSSFDYTSPVSGNTRRIIIFLGLTKKNPIISNEHCGFAWCDIEEGKTYLKFEDIQKCVNELFSKYVSLKE